MTNWDRLWPRLVRIGALLLGGLILVPAALNPNETADPTLWGIGLALILFSAAGTAEGLFIRFSKPPPDPTVQPTPKEPQ